MITFKEYIAEGFLGDLLTKLGEVKKEIAEDLGVRRYKIMVNRSVNDGYDGQRVIISVPIPSDHIDAQDFFEKMAVKATKKALLKHFPKHNFLSSQNVKWDDSRAIYMVAMVPDADGLLC
jgi:hypothetical protein